MKATLKTASFSRMIEAAAEMARWNGQQGDLTIELADDPGRIILTSGDDESVLTIAQGAKVERTGVACVSASSTQRLAVVLPDHGQVSIRAVGHDEATGSPRRLRIRAANGTSGHFQGDLTGRRPVDREQTDAPRVRNRFLVDTEGLMVAIELMLNRGTGTSTRYETSGAYVEIEEDALRFVGTDGRSMTTTRVQTGERSGGAPGAERRAWLGSAALHTLRALLQQCERDEAAEPHCVEMRIRQEDGDGGTLTHEWACEPAGYVLRAPVYERGNQDHPVLAPWRNLASHESAGSVTVERWGLAAALERITGLSARSDAPVILSAKRNQLRIRTDTRSAALDAEETLKCAYDGESREAIAPGESLARFVRGVRRAEHVTLGFAARAEGMLVASGDDAGSSTHWFMPVKAG